MLAAILGSAFAGEEALDIELEARSLETPWGPWTLHRICEGDTDAWLSFRHGETHRLMPHQIEYRAQAWALREAGCRALVVTSSVGVLDAELPLFEPLVVSDLLMPDNRLPDGSACTIFEEPRDDQGHLVLNEGLFSEELGTQLDALGEEVDAPVGGRAVFGYVGGPRTKTPAENRLWARLGAQVNSMTLGPEVVLANELEIPCAGLVVGHKYSVPEIDNPAEEGIAESLDRAREATWRLVHALLRDGRAPDFGNHIYRFGA